MHHLFASLALAGIIAVVAAVSAPTITNVRYAGNGCPRNTASHSASELNTTSNSIKLIHYLNEFTPTYGANVAAREAQKLCIPSIEITVDPAYKLRVNNIGTSVNGYVRLAYFGHDMRITANYTFPADTTVQVSANMPHKR